MRDGTPGEISWRHATLVKETNFMFYAKRWLLGLTVLFFLALVRGFGQTPPRFGSIEGTVIALNGKPVAGATVTAGVRSFTTTDSMGKFTLRDMPSGDALLYAHKEGEGYPDQFFSFFNTGHPWIRAKVEVGRVTQGITIQLGEKAACLNIKMTDEKGAPLGQIDAVGTWHGPEHMGLTFTRDDQPGHYGMGWNGGGPIMVPPVPFRLTAEADGYEPWHYGGENWQSNSGLITLKSGQSLNLDIRMRRAQ